jgi:preprotein translocase subunit SecF
MEETKEHAEHHTEHAEHEEKSWYDKSHKLMLIVPLAILVILVGYLVVFYSTNGDIFRKDVSLTGGTSYTVFDGKVDISKLGLELKQKFSDVSITKISDIRTGAQKGFVVETKASADEVKTALEGQLGYKLTQTNSSVEFSGASLSQGFYKQLIGAIIGAFLLMSLVVFLIFSESSKMKAVSTIVTSLGIGAVLASVPAMRFISGAGIFIGLGWGLLIKSKTKAEFYAVIATGVIALLLYFFYTPFFIVYICAIALVTLNIIYSIPSFIVILCAFSDMVMTIAVIDLIGINLSLSGVIAFLMLIGYSVDTDILLTTRVLRKRDESRNKRIWGAFKTGITMTLTTIAAIGISLALIYGLSDSLRQIFTILLIGLGFDIMNTWITNASIIKWYAEVKKI